MDKQMPQEPTTPQEPVKTAPVKEMVKTPNTLIILMAVVVLLLLGLVGYLVYRNMMLQNQISEMTVLSSPSPSPEGTPSPGATTPASPDSFSSWKTYKDETLGFQITYPPSFKVTEDKYGWPKAVLILYQGGQSYDLVIEVWNSESEYLAKYTNQSTGTLTVKQKGSQYFTLLNGNKDATVDQIISTFEFTN